MKRFDGHEMSPLIASVVKALQPEQMKCGDFFLCDESPSPHIVDSRETQLNDTVVAEYEYCDGTHLVCVNSKPYNLSYEEAIRMVSAILRGET